MKATKAKRKKAENATPAARKEAEVSHSIGGTGPSVSPEVSASGKPGPGPKVGDSAFMTAQEDHTSQGVPTSTSDGTGAPEVIEPNDDTLGKKGKGAKKAPLPSIVPVKMGDIVGFVTSGRVPGKFRPAIVIRATNPDGPNAEHSPIDLTAFPDSGKFPNNDHLGNVHFREGVIYDPEGGDGTWHKLDETDAIIAKLEESDKTTIERRQEKRNRR